MCAARRLPARRRVTPWRELVAQARARRGRRPGATSAHDIPWVRPPPRSARPWAGRCWRTRCPERAAGQAAVAHYDALLRDEAFAAGHRPDLVLRVGDLPVSKPLRTWLADLESVPQVALDPEGAWQDPASVLSDSLALATPATALRTAPRLASAAAVLGRPPTGLARELARRRRAGRRGDPGRLARRGAQRAGRRRRAGRAAAERRRPCSSHRRCRCATSRRSGRCAATPRACCATAARTASTGPCPARSARPPPRDGPVVLLIGDVALAHDIGGLLAAKRLGLKLTIVLLDNGGGGIFDFLPVSRTDDGTRANDVYTRHVATPTGLDFAQGRGAVRPASRAGGDDPRAARRPGARARAAERLHDRPRRARIAPCNVELHGRVWTRCRARTRTDGNAMAAGDE